jgi:hypothetical protein
MNTLWLGCSTEDGREPRPLVFHRLSWWYLLSHPQLGVLQFLYLFIDPPAARLILCALSSLLKFADSPLETSSRFINARHTGSRNRQLGVVFYRVSKVLMSLLQFSSRWGRRFRRPWAHKVLASILAVSKEPQAKIP